MCYEASGYKSDYKKIVAAQEKEKAFEEKKKNKSFASKEEHDKALEEYEKSKADAVKAQKSLQKRKQALQSDKSPLEGIIDVSYDPQPKIQPISSAEHQPDEEIPKVVEEPKQGNESDSYLRTSKPIYNKFKKQTLDVINIVYKVIGDVLPMENMKEALISKIEAEITK